MHKKDAERLKPEVVARLFESVNKRAETIGPPLEEVINRTLYHERERLKHASSAKDKADRAYLTKVRRDLPHASKSALKQLLTGILQRYVAEITGNFDPRVYKLTTSVLPIGLTALLNGLSPQRLLTRLTDLPTLDDHLIVQGEVDTLRRLQKLGTIILVPTHSSNLDSIIIGYAMFRLGLPPLVYGAGLNLFSNPITGFFMHNLGAYTVDRLKGDPMYRDALKEYATVTMEYGYDNLFFPGGTRSRSGAIERHLKKGLLGTGLIAFRNNLLQRRPRPQVYVVPATISYPLVLEGSTLIDDHLKRAGKARYIIVDDEFSRLKRWVDFARGLFALDLKIVITVGRPLDCFGNDVDAEGRSLDPRGRPVDPSRYLLVDGKIGADDVRDREYTSMLAERIVQRYQSDNVAMAEHVLAYAVFEELRSQRADRDLYRFLRDIGSETSLPITRVEVLVEQLLTEMKALAAKERLRLSSMLDRGDVNEIVRQALLSFGTYHTTPVIERRGVRLHVGDINLILYYRNRLDGYALLGAPDVVKPGGE